ncbi:polysaccharide deacetylase family protein [uncultured Winogradskyella sp.]|uniref:polysaccharide deacetylase family protein n=1 Tax=uncultured Winogradskyella sp. TaxID=395353 RepID=UPI00261C3E01|nr:polysaccharide deacetylase family protein [uncultured Winogradskyella sp.]
MQIIPAKTPKFIKSLFPNLIWSIESTQKEIYLTFDDGPTPEITDWVLNTLAEYDAKATFFCIGNNIEKHPDIFLRIIADGHSIGNHTFSHLKGWKQKTKTYIEDVEKTNQLINSKVENHPSVGQNLFRPPYGKFKVKQSKKLQKLGYKIILWDVLSYDWDKTVSEDACLNNVITATKKGSIIVFHDSLKASKNLRYVLPKVLAYFSEQGFKFRTLD